MAKIISFSAAKTNWKMGIDQAAAKDLFAKGVEKATGESSTHRKSYPSKSVNPYREIKELKRIIELKQQDIDLLIEMFEEVVSQ